MSLDRTGTGEEPDRGDRDDRGASPAAAAAAGRSASDGAGPATARGAFTRKHNPLLLALWTVLILVALGYNLHGSHAARLEQAKTEARTYYELNLAYRAMISRMGGVYAPVGAVAPNPYLHVPNREIRSSDGRTLTLVNPAYATRLAFEILKTRFNLPIRNKLTSLKYLNPDNAPTEWERRALQSFELGETEVFQVADLAGQPFLMLMKPFVTEESCLICHGSQGYKVGDIRGGISLAIPLKDYFAVAAQERTRVSVAHILLWLVGMVGLVSFSRKRYEQELRTRESEWKFRTVAETTNDWEFWLTPQGAITFMSPSSRAVTGYGPEEFTADSALLSAVVHPDDRPQWESHNRDMADPRHGEMEFRIVARDGSVKWIAHTCAPMYRDGTFIGRHSNNRDITARKEMELDLQRSERRHRTLFETMAQGVVYHAQDGSITSANPAAARILGVPTDQLLGLPPLAPQWRAIREDGSNFPGDQHPAMVALRTGVPVHGVVIGVFQPGGAECRWILVDAVPEFLPGETLPRQVYATFSDITEHRRLEDQLRQAQKMESIGTLAGGVAHDFNNILTAVNGYGHLTLMRMPPNDPNRPNIEQILEAADRAAHLTKDLLLFSRKQAIERRPLDLNEVVRRVEKFIVRVIGEDIACGTRLCEGRVPILADRHQLEQILMNLATNARDAMPQGGTFVVATEIVTVDEQFVSANGYGKPGAFALLTVSDTGEGMDAEVRKRIFEPFFTTKEVGKGTGLGLAVVYGIVTHHEGYINVSSEPGLGTTFRIYLPLVEADGQEAEKPPLLGDQVRGTETVLFAEDDPAVREMTETVLKDFGYTVITAVDGLDAVEKFLANRGRIRFLLFDLIMPRKNGREACDEIRKVAPGIKVLFASGYSPDIIRDKASLGAGADIIFKPISPADLLRKIRGMLDAEPA